MISPVHTSPHNPSLAADYSFSLASTRKYNCTGAEGKRKQQHVFVKDKAEFCSAAAAFREHSAICAHHQREDCQEENVSLNN